ncbi:MAG: clostripain-related cysteine peptidase [Elusimicrobiota bacterium]|nr:clostripain-related cysteine peptidase [Elusimicrobiota bacterium]
MIKNKIIIKILALAFIVIFNLNSKAEIFDMEKIFGNKIIKDTAARQAANPVADKKDLTVMVFKNAKNDLEEFSHLDMNEMEKVGSTDKMNIIVEYGRLKNPSAPNDWHGVRRYFVTKDTDEEVINSKVLWAKEKADMGSWKELADFVIWSKAHYPAEKYLLIVWNHGNGWKKSVKRNFVQKGISFDDETGNHISTPELRKAFVKAGYVDVVAFDACLMQTAEVAYEIRDFTEVVTASEDTEPGDGYPYDRVFEGFENEKNLNSEKMGEIIVKAFQKRNSEFYMDTTQSAIRVATLERLLKLLNEWTVIALASGEGNVIKRAFLSAQGFYEIDQKDIYDFLKVTEKYSSNEKFKNKSEEIMKYLIDEVVIANGITGYRHVRAKGLAIYAPLKYVYNDEYEDLLWARDGVWDEFLKNR